MIASPVRIYAPLSPRFFFVREEDSQAARKRLLFHVEQGDYFLTLATILMLLKDQLDDAIRGNTAPTPYQSSVLQSMHDDLVYLAGHWKIMRKERTEE